MSEKRLMKRLIKKSPKYQYISVMAKDDKKDQAEYNQYFVKDGRFIYLRLFDREKLNTRLWCANYYTPFHDDSDILHRQGEACRTLFNHEEDLITIEEGWFKLKPTTEESDYVCIEPVSGEYVEPIAVGDRFSGVVTDISGGIARIQITSNHSAIIKHSPSGIMIGTLCFVSVVEIKNSAIIVDVISFSENRNIGEVKRLPRRDLKWFIPNEIKNAFPVFADENFITTAYNEACESKKLICEKDGGYSFETKHIKPGVIDHAPYFIYFKMLDDDLAEVTSFSLRATGINQIFFRDFYIEKKDFLSDLADIAIKEYWGENNYILQSYFYFTYYAAKYQNKVIYKEYGEKKLLSFNTGLVTPLYDPIFACFAPSGKRFMFKSFAVPGGGVYGKMLTQLFDNLPEAVEYGECFFDPDLMLNRCDFDINHIINRIERLPQAFLRQVTGNRNGNLKSVLYESEELKKIFYQKIKDAKDLAVKKARYDKSISYMYYPAKNCLSLLLPIELTGETVALVLTYNENSKRYQAETIITVGMAYRDVRLIKKPTADWLTPKEREEDE